MHRYTRRRFLQTATCLLAAVPFAGLAADHAKPCTVACRDTHLKTTGQADCWAALKGIGVSGVEVNVNRELACSSLFHPGKQYRLDTPDGQKILRDDLAAQGMAITAFCMNNQLDGPLESEIAWAKKLASVAAQMKVHAIRIDVVPQKTPRDQFLPVALKACRQLCDLVEGTPVRYGIENHGNTTNDPEFLERLFDGVNSKNLGLTLDTGNFYWYGHPLQDVYKIFERFAARVVHTHCKNIRFPEEQRNVRRPMGWEYDKFNCPIYEGDIDYRKLTSILRQAGYQGDLCIEDEALDKYPADQRLGVLKKEADLLKTLV
jgi:sugar phosphate isomerase/epimerase